MKDTTAMISQRRSRPSLVRPASLPSVSRAAVDAPTRAPYGNDHWRQGAFREVELPCRLVLTRAWEKEGLLGAETRITVSFEDLGGRARTSFSKGDFATPETSDGHTRGWQECFDNREAYAHHV